MEMRFPDENNNINNTSNNPPVQPAVVPRTATIGVLTRQNGVDGSQGLPPLNELAGLLIGR